MPATDLKNNPEIDMVCRNRLMALSSPESAPHKQDDASSPQQQPQQQFLRLPMESAKKLRFYDRQELSDLVAQHIREKQQLEATNGALRKVRGVSGGT